MKILPVTRCVITGVLALAATDAWTAKKADGGVPFLDVKSSCADAQKFSSQGNDKNLAFKGCMQDEMNAKDTLVKQWSTFQAKDKTSCVEQSRAPSPSYVEVLTCLEMNTNTVGQSGRSTPKVGGVKPPKLPPGTR